MNENEVKSELDIIKKLLIANLITKGLGFEELHDITGIPKGTLKGMFSLTKIQKKVKM